MPIEEGKAAPPFTLQDADGNAVSLKSLRGSHVMYGRRTMGVIRSTVLVDPQGKVKKHWARVPKADAHPQKVLEILQAG